MWKIVRLQPSTDTESAFETTILQYSHVLIMDTDIFFEEKRKKGRKEEEEKKKKGERRKKTNIQKKRVKTERKLVS